MSGGLKYTNIAATTAAVANRFVASTNMKVGAYTVANASPVWAGGCLITCTATAVDTADTMGTLVIVGKDLWGNAQTETLVPSTAGVVTGTKIFRSVTSVTGAGWVIDAAEASNDTIVVGCAAASYAATGGGKIHSVIVNNSVAAAIVISDSAGTILTVPASQAAGSEFLLGGVPWSGFLKIATTSTNDVTVIHSPGVPPSYAMS